MFGFIRPFKPELRVKEVERFQAVYCGLCHTLKKRYGRLQTYFLSYDMTFFCLLLQALEEQAPNTTACRCDASPFRKKKVVYDTSSFEYAADVSVLLLYHKLQDSIQDEHGLKRPAAQTLKKMMRKHYQRAQAAYPTLDQTMQDCLRQLTQLEQEQSASLDRPADTFARLMAATVPQHFPPQIQRILGQMFYHTGRWLYLLDACADLKDDFASGSYNPVRLRFALEEPSLTPVKETLEHTLERSLLDIHTAFQLLPLYRDQELIANIIDFGLPIVTRQVLDGTYHANGGHKTHGSL